MNPRKGSQMREVSRTVLQPASAKWIAGRVQTLLSHYYRPDDSPEVFEAAIVDWVKALTGHTQDQIEAACEMHLRDAKTHRPKPADILGRIKGGGSATGHGRGDRSKLSADEIVLLDAKVLPAARRWLNMPGLADHGRQTLNYWGES